MPETTTRTVAGAREGGADPGPRGVAALLPADATDALLLGRVHDPETDMPRPVVVNGHGVWDLFGTASTVAGLLANSAEAAGIAREEMSSGPPRWSIDEITLGDEPGDRPLLLAPLDLQVLKACGVTFAGSMVERVIEERAAGDPVRAREVREDIGSALGASIDGIAPGSPESARLKAVLTERGLWSQYLEVGLGPDPEIFTKGPVLSAVGSGSHVGIPAFSRWNNPEPELVLIVDEAGRIAGVTLGNDVNLRDVEGRSALLLGMAKDNNRSTAIGPFVRLFDEGFTIDDARSSVIELTVTGAGGYRLEGVNRVGALSRSLESLVAAARGAHHQYPDGFALFTGTLFAPTADRHGPGQGFTHEIGDLVEIRSERLGALTNRVGRCEELPEWTYGVQSLIGDLLRA